MGFVKQSGEDRRKIALHGVTFALGVLASFGILSGILFAARTAAGGSGNTIGWGYQLQNPWVVFTLMLLMFVLALSMFGLFEVGTSATAVGGPLQSKQGLGGSFFSGVLATIVATPCSAPFLGVALGTAVGLPAVQFFAAFAAVAIGLALPYLILSLFPGPAPFSPPPGGLDGELQTGNVLPAVCHRWLSVMGLRGSDRIGSGARPHFRTDQHCGRRLDLRTLESSPQVRENPRDRGGPHPGVCRRGIPPRQTAGKIGLGLGAMVANAGR